MMQCPHCGEKFKKTEFVTVIKKLAYEDGTVYSTVEQQEEHCPVCGWLFYNDELHNKNLEAEREADRKFFNIISLEDMKRIPKKYGTNRAVIEAVLDIDNYSADEAHHDIWKGDLPTSEESDRMKKALESPSYFLDMLKKHEGEIMPDEYKKIFARAVKLCEKELCEKEQENAKKGN